jgi:hypothetical protein
MKNYISAFALIVIAIIFCSWGGLVHKTIHQLAIYQLPEGMRETFFMHADYFVKNASRPDTRRNSDSTEATKHFIDIEAYGKNAIYTMPLSWQKAKAIYSEDTLKTYGYVPYVIVDMQQKLTHAFKAGLKDSILFYATDLGHYIGDAHVPLHTSINYDGQLSNQKGIHALWESMIPEIELDEFNLYTNHTATYIKKPDEAIWKTIRHTNTLVKDVFAKEVEVSKSFTENTKYRTQTRRGKEVKYYTTEFAKAYYAALKGSINKQLIYSSEMIADFWFTAWVDAGKPNLNKIFNEEISTNAKESLQFELKAFKQNELIKNNLLKAKNKVESNE